MSLSRTQQMARIRSRGTGPERRLIEILGVETIEGYAEHLPTRAGRPDLVFAEAKVAIFVDGCFWHGCPLHYVRPGTREAFWSAKLHKNVTRDRRQTLQLEGMGWRVVRLWEHEIREAPEQVLVKVRAAFEDADIEPGFDWRVVQVEEIDSAQRIERRYLEDLRDPWTTDIQEGRRITAKGRPSTHSRQS